MNVVTVNEFLTAEWKSRTGPIVAQAQRAAVA